MLITAIVHHGHSSLLLVLDPRHLFCLKKPGLITIQLTKKIYITSMLRKIGIFKSELIKHCKNINDISKLFYTGLQINLEFTFHPCTYLWTCTFTQFTLQGTTNFPLDISQRLFRGVEGVYLYLFKYSI